MLQPLRRTTTTSAKANQGPPNGKSHTTKGTRRREPSDPYLFEMIMEFSKFKDAPSPQVQPLEDKLEIYEGKRPQENALLNHLTLRAAERACLYTVPV